MMIEAIGSAAMLEQLAEESAELAQAALKAARILRDDNPTPGSRCTVRILYSGSDQECGRDRRNRKKI